MELTWSAPDEFSVRVLEASGITLYRLGLGQRVWTTRREALEMRAEHLRMALDDNHGWQPQAEHMKLWDELKRLEAVLKG